MVTERRPLHKCVDCPTLIGGPGKRCKPCAADKIERDSRAYTKRKRLERKAMELAK